MVQATCKIGKRGAFVIPTSFRDRYGLTEGSLVILEEHEKGVLIRPAIAFPVEHYTLERKAEFLLTNAVNDNEYNDAVQTVKEMGLDPTQIPHQKPKY